MSASVFQDAKVWLIETLDMSRDALHVHVGLAIFFGVALAFRRSLGSWLPLLAVAVAALAGEAWDWIDDARGGHAHVAYQHWHDLANTLLWPIVLFTLARATQLMRR